MVHRLKDEEKIYSVYILASKPYGTLYIGVTGDLISRVVEHRSGEKPGFTRRYKVFTLVHFEPFGEIDCAIQREKTMKKWPRQWKINLIERENPHWQDLFPQLTGDI
ncbi:MAG: GIY-YIG nuclease family protein, partial [Aestuariivirga sp.]